MLAVLQETTSAEKKVEILYSSRGYFSASQVSLDMLCRVHATGRNCRQMRRKNVFDTKKISFNENEWRKKFSS